MSQTKLDSHYRSNCRTHLEKNCKCVNQISPVILSSPLGKILHRLYNSMIKAMFNKVHACTGLFQRLWRLIYRLKSFSPTRNGVFVFCGSSVEPLFWGDWGPVTEQPTRKTKPITCFQMSSYVWWRKFISDTEISGGSFFLWSFPRLLNFEITRNTILWGYNDQMSVCDAELNEFSYSWHRHVHFFLGTH